jgi:integrase
MKNLKLYLDTRRTDAKGTAVVKIRLIKDRVAAYISTDIRLTPEQWDSELGLVVKHPRAKNLNVFLANEVMQVEDIMLQNHEEFRALSATEVMRQVQAQRNPEKLGAPKDLFYPFAVKFMESKEKTRTKEIYAATLSRLKDYTDYYDELRFTDITIDWLKNFDKFLQRYSPSANARAIHLRNIRAVFNAAIDEELITHYPFRKYKIKTEETVKRSLTVRQLARLFLYEPKPYAEKYLDMFKLMFYLIGINTVDLAGLTEIRSGRIEYHRAKTNRLYSIKVEPEALEIIKKYIGEKDKLLNVFEDRDTYQSFGRLMNLALHDIGKEMDGRSRVKTFTNLTTYWARHTWATIAAELDIPKETIAKALGHGGREVTDVYIRFDDKKIDKANRQVIDYLNEHIEKLKAGN